MWEMLLLGAGVVAGWLTYDTWRARDAAVAAARATCAQHGLQFLDDTVRRDRSRLARDGDGRVLIEHCFVFEFSDDKVSRRGGAVTIRGAAVDSVVLEPFLLS